MSNPAANVYVVDDEQELRDSVVHLLEDAGYQSRAFPSGGAILAAHPQLSPGCIIVDMFMPDMSGLELQRRLVAAGCRWPFILLTGRATRRMVTDAMESGFIAFLEKPVRDAELIAAVMKGQAQLLGKGDMMPDPQLVQRLASLTGRQREIVGYLLQNKRNKQIGAILGIEETTVKGYRRALMKKLGVHNPTELLVFAIRAGIYSPRKS